MSMKKRIQKELLTDQELREVVKYLIRQCPLWNDFSHTDIQFLTVHTMDAEYLRIWCKKYLEPHHWRRLNTRFRVNQKRARDIKAGDAQVTVTLTASAWTKLTGLAKEQDTTLSEVIEKRL